MEDKNTRKQPQITGLVEDLNQAQAQICSHVLQPRDSMGLSAFINYAFDMPLDIGSVKEKAIVLLTCQKLHTCLSDLGRSHCGLPLLTLNLNTPAGY